MGRPDRPGMIRRIVGCLLLAAGGLIVLGALPLWFWLVLLGTACVVVGWLLVAGWP